VKWSGMTDIKTVAFDEFFEIGFLDAPDFFRIFLQTFS
jgi:hypothetical protein